MRPPRFAIKEVPFRGDVAFARLENYEAHEARQVKYAIRLPASANLQRKITELLKRPAGRPSHQPVVQYKSFLYQVARWTITRRLVAKVEFHFRAKQVRLWLSMIAYNLGNRWRRLALPREIGKWSLTSLQRRLVKTGCPLSQGCCSDPLGDRGYRQP